MHHRRLRLKKKQRSPVSQKAQFEDTPASQSTKKRKRNNSNASPTKPPAFSANGSSADFPREIVTFNVTASNQVCSEVISLEEINEERSAYTTAVEDFQQIEGPRTRKLPKGTRTRKLPRLRHLTRFMSAIRKPKPTVKCYIRSLHGYSSLRMFEAKPRACMSKVRA